MGGFCNCTSLTSVTISDSVTSIGNEVFYGCTKLNDVYYTGTEAEWNAISIGSGNEKLINAQIHYEEETSTASGTCGENLTWTLYATGELVINGMGAMYDWSSSNSVPWYSHRSSIKSVTIGDGVTTIGDLAFYYCDSLANVTISDSVKSIGYSAFSSCESLESITIPDSVTFIDNFVFPGCTSLESVTLSGSVTSIGEYAFYGCTSITSITIPDSVTSISDYAFEECKSLASVTIGNSVTSIGVSAFSSCTSLASVTIPDSVTSIGNWAFDDCTSLTSVIIPDSVTIIASGTFSGCTSLTSVIIPNSVTNIGDSAFSSCKSLESVTISDSVISIGMGTFTGCGNLESVTIPDSVTSIGNWAFADCSNLASVTIGNNVTSISVGAFDGCENLAVTYYEGTPEQWAGISIGLNNEYLTKNVVFISASGVCGENLTWTLYATGELVINGTGAMWDWSSYSDVPWYSNRFKIKRLTIGSGVTSIGEQSFRHCSSLSDITVDTNNQYYSNDEHGVLFDKNKTTLVQYPIGNTRISYIIPEGVTKIGNFAFDECNNLTNITIPDGLKTIGKYAFNRCKNLSEIEIPDGVNSIGECAFWMCDLRTVTIPDSVSNLGECAFYGCPNLISVTIGSRAVIYKNNVFFACDSLASITVDEKNSYVSSDEYGVMFDKNKNKLMLYPCGNTRTSYVIPESVYFINAYAFCGCGNLTTIVIEGRERLSIAPEAFDEYSGLKDVYYSGTEEEWNTNVYINSNNEPFENATIHFNHSHNYEEIPDISSTCKEQGRNLLQCVCGKTNGYADTPLLPHIPGEWETVAEPDCESDGLKVKKCSVCGDTAEEEIIPALEHDIIIDEAVDATCTSTGLTEGQHCSRCDDATVKQEVTPILGHDIVIDEAVDATCTSTGLTEGQHCSRCDGATVDQEITAVLGHDIVIDEAVDATCTSTGLTEGQHCSRCDGATVDQEITAVLGHDIVIDEAVDATCTSTGLTEGQHCSRCDDMTVKQEVTPVLGHDIVIDEAVDATCISTGLTEGQHCSRCDDATVEQEIVSVKSHNYVVKYDSVKHWKECSCETKIETKNHSFVSGNICSCGYKRVTIATVSIKNNNGSKTIKYGETLKLTAIVTNKPANAKIYWYVDGVMKGEGDIFNVKFENGTKIVTVKLVDSNSVVYQDASGIEISDSENVTVNAGFFQKLISFFKNLFGMNRTIVQAFKGTF